MNQPMKGPMNIASVGEAIVTASVPRGFILTLPSGIPIRVLAGTQEMPESIATHFYSKANGVQVLGPSKAVEPAVEPVASAPQVDAARRPGRPPKAQS